MYDGKCMANFATYAGVVSLQPYRSSVTVGQPEPVIQLQPARTRATDSFAEFFFDARQAIAVPPPPSRHRCRDIAFLASTAGWEDARQVIALPSEGRYASHTFTPVT